jgi:hypothetical protein
MGKKQFSALHRNSVHPFPARMAASIPWALLSSAKTPLAVLDPMMGSGTTLSVAKALGHKAIGFDTDPLSVILSSTLCSRIDPDRLRTAGEAVLQKARRLSVTYPSHADNETRRFLRFWFDSVNRKQLARLALAIQEVRDRSLRTWLWCCFSRLIISKQAGTSLALDLPHSRPHRGAKNACVKAFDQFPRAIELLLKAAPFVAGRTVGPAVSIRRADARRLPLHNDSIDVAITSPPYLNALDYLRGHKFSLVWMGYRIEEIRSIRSSNIGAELSLQSDDASLAPLMKSFGRVHALSKRQQGMLVRYLVDMRAVVRELGRVIKPGGTLLMVIGDCQIAGIPIKNSRVLRRLAEEQDFQLQQIRRRRLPPNRRYLPPPSKDTALSNRMRSEAILTLRRR